MSSEAERILAVARQAARDASRICRAVLAEAPATPDAMAKLGKEPVTVADYGSQAVILRRVQAEFPDHGVIAEEGSEHLREHAGDEGSQQIQRLVQDVCEEAVDFDQVCTWIDHDGGQSSPYTWAIDPIDGTKGFLRREQFAVAIGILKNGQPWAGALACPNLPVDPNQPDGPRGLLFCALQGEGAAVEAIDDGSPQPCRGSSIDGPAKARILGSVESAHGDPRLLTALVENYGIGGGIVRVDSQAKYAMVAHGGAEIYLRPRSRPDYRENIWDHAAGVIVVQEAGGRVTDLDGKALDFSLGRKLEQNRGVLATNGPLHDAVLASLREAEAALA